MMDEPGWRVNFFMPQTTISGTMTMESKQSLRVPVPAAATRDAQGKAAT
jgi:hypothetical protein